MQLITLDQNHSIPCSFQFIIHYSSLHLPAQIKQCVLFIKQPQMSQTLGLSYWRNTVSGRVLRKAPGSTRDEVTGTGEDYELKSFMICTPLQELSGGSNKERRDGPGMWNVWERCIQGFGGERCWNDFTWKTPEWMGEY